MLKKELLERFVPFNELSPEYIDEALRDIKGERFKKGEMLFKRGRKIDRQYFLVDGKIDLIDSSFHVSTLQHTDKQARSALNSESPTRCSAVAKSSQVLAFSISKSVLDRIISWSQAAISVMTEPVLPTATTGEYEAYEIEEEGSDWMSALLQSPLFSKIPLSQVQELFMRFDNCIVKNGDTVVKEGAKGDFFYVIAAGSVRVFNRPGSVNIELGPGNYFGEEALLGNTLRNATVQMTSDGLLKRLVAEDFNALLKNPVLQYLENDGLKQLDRSYKLLDVKMPIEFRAHHVPGSVNVPLSRLRSKLSEFADKDVYVVSDDAGSRADIAAHLLCQAGFEAFILKSGNS